MDQKTRIVCESRAAVFKALAHPTRVFIVGQLAEGERCVCELTALLPADTSTISKHLSVLKAAGIVADDKRGLMVYYSLKMKCVLGFFSCIGKAVEEQAKEQLAAMEG